MRSPRLALRTYHSVTPPWLTRNYPKIDNVVTFLCHTPCADGCAYCRDRLNIYKKHRQFFGYDSFRTYAGEPLQEREAQAAADGKALLAVFPTGGGKFLQGDPHAHGKRFYGKQARNPRGTALS